MVLVCLYKICVAGVGIALKQAMTSEFKIYQKQVVSNSKALSTALQARGYTIVSGIPIYLIFTFFPSFNCYVIYFNKCPSSNKCPLD